jgi:hypothetical protein
MTLLYRGLKTLLKTQTYATKLVTSLVTQACALSALPRNFRLLKFAYSTLKTNVSSDTLKLYVNKE